MADEEEIIREREKERTRERERGREIESVLAEVEREEKYKP